MAGPTIVGSVTGNTTTGVAVTPAGAAAGDTLLFFICAYGTSSTVAAGQTSFTPPAGATLVPGGGPFGHTFTLSFNAGPTRVWLYQMLLTGAPAATYTFTLVGDAQFGGTDVATICLRGAATVAFDSGAGAPTSGNSPGGGSANASAPGLTPSYASELLLWFYFGQNQTLSAVPSGMTAHVITTSGPTASSWELASQQLTTPSATGAKTATTTADEWIAVMLAVIPTLSDGPYCEPPPQRASVPPRRPPADPWYLAPLAAATALATFLDQGVPVRGPSSPARPAQEFVPPPLSFGRGIDWSESPLRGPPARPRRPVDEQVLDATQPPPTPWVDWSAAPARAPAAPRRPVDEALSWATLIPVATPTGWGPWTDPPARGRGPVSRLPLNDATPLDALVVPPTATWGPWDAPAVRPQTPSRRAPDNPAPLPPLTFGAPFLGQDEPPRRAALRSIRIVDDFVFAPLAIPLATFLDDGPPMRGAPSGRRRLAPDGALPPLALQPPPSVWADWDGPAPRPWRRPRWSPDDPPFFFSATTPAQTGPLALWPSEAALLSCWPDEAPLLVAIPNEEID